MTDYYSFKFIVRDKPYNCIWFSNDKDGFITVSNQLKHFDSYEELDAFTKENNLAVIDEGAILNIDTAKIWLKENRHNVDCEYFLDFWNLISDLAGSVGDNFYGDSNKGIINKIYNKLFYGSNLPALRKDGEVYIPDWAEEELYELCRVVYDGLRIVDENIIAR